MPTLGARVERAAALHRAGAGVLAVAGSALAGYAPAASPRDQYAEQHDLAATMRAAASALTPGWLGAALDARAAATPLGGTHAPRFVRIGQAHPLDDARFPVVVPLLGTGHLAVDADARDSRVAGLLRSLVLRLLATAPAGSLRVRAVDAAGSGTTFAEFRDIEPVLPPPATDLAGLRAALAEAEGWLCQPAVAGGRLLLVVASLPELTEPDDLDRFRPLAQAGPAAGVHLVLAGWPPPPLSGQPTEPPLPLTTQITLRNPYSWVGDPPTGTFTASGPTAPGPTAPGSTAPGSTVPGPGLAGTGRLNAPAYLDPDPPAELVDRVCAELSSRLAVPTGDDPGHRATEAADAPEASVRAWDEYLAAARRLDTSRRVATSVVSEQHAALRLAREALTGLAIRLADQQNRLRAAAHLAGVATPVPAPSPADLAAARRRIGPAPTPEAVVAAVTATHGALDRADGLLPATPGAGTAPAASAPPAFSAPPAPPASAPPPAGHTAPVASAPPAPVGARNPPVLRNAAVYGGYALLGAVVQIPLCVLTLIDRRPLSVLALAYGAAVVTILVFALGWLTVAAVNQGATNGADNGATNGADNGTDDRAVAGAGSSGAARSGRSPLLGALLSLLSLTPWALGMAWLALTAVLR